ncbi:MAG: anhydro-N-acetylmuramic acid kinase [Prolixibacteraceae bacterium]|nr:anhydro-N-acetylmuramic acid kinase [Prolixibacteraceae bacterium]MBN2775718.1 anhydro-N-acetylmuramic acid kinase [Prolixibacteraceae bacterium]
MKLHFLNKKQVTVIGIMSGTSLDGLDFATCRFSFKNKKWEFEILKSATFTYNRDWKKLLENAPELTSAELLKLNQSFGKFIGEKVNEFKQDFPVNIDLISSHGHTVFHQPEIGLTYQIGDGAQIAQITGITTISDFRSTDVALGGQGAPLVPVGDKYLFKEFDYCLNLGGFSNISYDEKGKRIAFDICPVNIVLNYLAEKKGSLFDKDGILGSKGNINIKLLEQLNKLPYYAANPPKSLGREWVEKSFLPVLLSNKLNQDDIFRTVYEHIAFQIGKTLKINGRALLSGGGTHNSFLLERLKKYTEADLVIPDFQIINYKEAIIFAFLGLLKVSGEINCISSVTGASRDSSCGVVHFT